MKAKYFSYTLAILLTAVVGCSKESSDLLPQTKQKITIKAGYEETKTFGVETIKFNKVDKLSVFDSKGLNNVFAQPSDEAEAAVSASFDGEISAGSQPKYVVYPYEAESTISNDVITVTVPNHYKAVNANSVLRGMNISVGEVVKNDGKYSATLRNLCGIVGVQIPAGALALRNVKLSANEPLTGTVSMKYDGGAPVVTDVTNGHTSVDFDVMLDTNTKLITEGKFYFSVLPGTYTGLKLTLTLESGETKEITTDKSLTVTRGSRTLLPVTLADILNAPSVERGQVVVHIDFPTKKTNTLYYYNSEGVQTYLPTASGSELTESKTVYCDNKIDGVTYSFPFHIITDGESNYRYMGSTYTALNMNPGLGVTIVCPAIPGYYLSGVKCAAYNNTYKYTISNVYGRENLTKENSLELTVGKGTLPENNDSMDALFGTKSGQVFYLYPTTKTSYLQQLRLLYYPEK